MKIDKSKFRDSRGGYITQGLFVDFNFDSKYAVYCLSDEDRVYEGVSYPSLKKLYLAMEDPTEYAFANTYLYSWSHWQRISRNAILAKHIAEWREELELKMRAKAIKALLSKASDGDVAAAKWISDKGWEGTKRGRPSKAEIERQKQLDKKLDDDTASEVARVIHLIGKEVA